MIDSHPVHRPRMPEQHRLARHGRPVAGSVLPVPPLLWVLYEPRPRHRVPEQPTHAVGDVTLLERALSNVVHNAVRYNEADGHVAVVLSTRAGRFTLRVVDDGPGLDPEDLPRLTERGYRGNAARTRHPHGMGLGLHITADVLVQHGFLLRLQRPEGAERGLEVLIEGAVVSAEGSASTSS